MCALFVMVVGVIIIGRHSIFGFIFYRMSKVYNLRLTGFSHFIVEKFLQTTIFMNTA